MRKRLRRLFVLSVLGLIVGMPGYAWAQGAAPAKIKHVDPVYPPEAQANRIQGTVIVQITVGTDGRVSAARVLRSLPMLDEAALDAVKQWVYDAATIKAPVTLTVTVPFGVTAPPAANAPPATRPVPPVAAAPRAAPPRPTATGAVGAATARESAELSLSSFSTDGLNYETELTGLYLGDFSNARLEPDSIEFAALFANYLSAFARHCDAYLPPDKVELTRLECAREQYTVNGYGVRIGPSTCIEYREVGTGLYADPAWDAARKRVAAALQRDIIRDAFGGRTDSNPMGMAMRNIDATRSVGRDMESLIETNGCASAGMKRFENNMRRFALGEPPLRLPGGETLASIRPKTPPGASFKDSNYSRLLEDLVAENSQGWMVNRFVLGSVSEVTVSHRDELGRPVKITGNYLFDGLKGRSRGSVTVEFADGLPQCVYFSDLPTTCRKASRRIITAYEKGRYQQ